MAEAVSGPDRDGAAVSTNEPVLVGGVDNAGNVQTLLVGTDGSLGASITGTQTVQGPVANDGVSTANPQIVGGVYSSSPAKVSASGDAVTLSVTQEGKLLTPSYTVAADTKSDNTNYSSAQTNTALTNATAPGANKRLVIVEIMYSCDTAGNMKLVEDPAGTPATKWGPHYFPANGGMVSTQCYIPLSANKALGITTVNSGNHTITTRCIVENV